jgi:hypothetical protein
MLQEAKEKPHIGAVLIDGQPVLPLADRPVYQFTQYVPWTTIGADVVIVEDSSSSYYRARYYDPQGGRFMSEDPIDWLGGDVNFYRYASNEPSRFIDPLERTVYICHRPLNLVGFFSFLNNHPNLVTHTWIRTESKEAGLGPANGTVPGQNAPADLPFTPTAVVDHTGESKAPNASCTAVPDEDEDCVNEQLRLGTPQGRFIPGINDCSTFASKVLNKCDLHPHPLVRGRRLMY